MKNKMTKNQRTELMVATNDGRVYVYEDGHYLGKYLSTIRQERVIWHLSNKNHISKLEFKASKRDYETDVATIFKSQF